MLAPRLHLASRGPFWHEHFMHFVCGPLDAMEFLLEKVPKITRCYFYEPIHQFTGIFQATYCFRNVLCNINHLCESSSFAAHPVSDSFRDWLSLCCQTWLDCLILHQFHLKVLHNIFEARNEVRVTVYNIQGPCLISMHCVGVHGYFPKFRAEVTLELRHLNVFIRRLHRYIHHHTSRCT